MSEPSKETHYPSQEYTQETQPELQLEEQECYEEDFDLEETYLNRLKTQRKRIEELSKMHISNEEKMKKQVDKNKLMKEEIEKLAPLKDLEGKYQQITIDCEKYNQQNRCLRQKVEDLKSDLLQTNNDKNQLVQKMSRQISLLKDKSANKVDHLEQALNIKEQEIEKKQKQVRAKEKQLEEIVSGYKQQITKLKESGDLALLTEKRKNERLERQVQSKTLSLSEIQSNIDSLLKENSYLKEQIFKISTELSSRQLENRTQLQKNKLKTNAMKKEIKQKERQSAENRQNCKREERLRKQLEEELENVKQLLRKVKENHEGIVKKMEVQFNAEKISLQTALNQQMSSIEDLIGVKSDLLNENKKLSSALRKKEQMEKQRKNLFRNEMKEIDKLEKVIDKIAD